MTVEQFTTEELQSEEWRPVEQYTGRYSVSSLGRVRSEATRSIMRPSVSKGYERIVLYLDGKPTTFKIHRLVAQAFIGSCPPLHVVNHRDAIKRNNRAVNLEYLSHQDNIRHAAAKGLLKVERRPRPDAATLTISQVREIRRAHHKGHSINSLSLLCNVQRSTIRRVLDRITWQHVA